MNYAPVLVTPAASLPVTRTEAKTHLRVDGSGEDSLIDLYLGAAIDHLDGPRGWLGRAIVEQTWSQQFDGFADSLYIDLSPIQSITSVVYLDANGDEQTVASSNYFLISDTGARPELRFIDDFVVPITQDQKPTITVTFVTGYDTVPPAIKAAILLIVGDLYQNRESKLETGMIENKAARMLLDPYRTRWIA